MRVCVYVACIIFIVPPCECKVRGRDSTAERLGSSLQGKHNDRLALSSAVVSTFKTLKIGRLLGLHNHIETCSGALQ
jgi:hypothetical protein